MIIKNKKDKNNLIDRIDVYRKHLDIRGDSVEPSYTSTILDS